MQSEASSSRLSQEEAISMLNTLVDTYGNNELNRFIAKYTEKIERLSKLNLDLTSIDQEAQEGEFNQKLQEIMAATQDYYMHVASLPHDLRRFLLLSADSLAVNDGYIDAINEVFGSGITFPAAPPLMAQAIRPGSYIMQIDAITNQLATLGERNEIQVGKRGGQPVTTTVTLDMPEHMKIEGGHALTSYDKSIINGVTSLLESGNSVFSIPMLYHAMTGRQNPTVDEPLYDELSGKLEKMRRMMLSIDLTGENEARYITGEDGEQLKIEDLTLDGYLLPLNRITGMVNGKKAELYQILQHPPLYSYSKMKRQLASVKISLLGAPVNNNSTTIPLKTYLLQRIEMMKNRKNAIISNTILYDSIYQELGAAEANKTKKMRIRSYTEAILGYFVEQGYIKSYAEFKKGRAIAGVNVVVC